MHLRLGVILLLCAACASAQGPSRTQNNKPLTILEKEWFRVDRVVPGAPLPKVLWKGEPLVHPRGIMLDEEKNLLYITDPGEPYRDPVNKPARIVTFSVNGGQLGTPKVFFSKPGFMIGAKWGALATINGQKQILVADQGKSLDDYRFTGEDAKVFTIPILEDGTAGTPKILWAGKPFVCPTGIAYVPDFIYITDPCSGPRRTRPEMPSVSFPSSSIFALDPRGKAAPITLKSGAPFTSLIGICILTPGEIIVNDTDSGRLEPKGTGGRPGFAPPAGADRWILKILDPRKPELSSPVRTRFTEEGPLTLEISPSIETRLAKVGGSIRISTRGITRIAPLAPRDSRGQLQSTIPDSRSLVLNARSVRESSRIALNVASDMTENTVTLDISGSGFKPFSVSVPKSATQNLRLLDNKHGGAKTTGFGGGGASGTWMRYTTDNAPGHGAVLVYRDDGGPVAVLAQGAPLERPISAQLSADGETLWIVDQQSASILSVPFPPAEMFSRLFPVGSSPGDPLQ
jgi:hypothetical protein